MEGHELEIACEAEVGFYESGAKLDGAFKGRKCILRRVARRAAMSDNQRRSHGVRYPIRLRYSFAPPHLLRVV
jgi:hypothetical protein